MNWRFWCKKRDLKFPISRFGLQNHISLKTITSYKILFCFSCFYASKIWFSLICLSIFYIFKSHFLIYFQVSQADTFACFCSIFCVLLSTLRLKKFCPELILSQKRMRKSIVVVVPNFMHIMIRLKCIKNSPKNKGPAKVEYLNEYFIYIFVLFWVWSFSFWIPLQMITWLPKVKYWIQFRSK